MALVSPPILPTEPLLAELLGPGPRSGAARYVPSQYATLQAAVDVARYGDTIVVAPGTQLTNTLLPTEAAVKARGSYPTRPENGNPSDILVVMGLPAGSSQRFYDLANKTSVAPATRVLTNAAYPGGKTVMKVSNRVTHIDAGYDVNNETRATPLLPYFPVGASINFTAAPYPAYWRFVGLEFSDGFGFDAGHGWNTPNNQTEPHHLTWDRCLFNSDPARNASHQLCGAYVTGPVRNYTVINSTYSNFCGHTAGDAGIHMFTSGSTWYFENVGAECLNFFFTGGSGGGAYYVGENPHDIVFRRCHIWRPEFWLPTEPSPGVNVQPSGPYTVNIDAAGVVSYVSGTPSWLDNVDMFSGQCFEKGTYIYDPATGIAREIAGEPYGFRPGGDGSGGSRFNLTQPWPGGAQTNLVIYPLYGHMIHVSGLTAPTQDRAQVSGTSVTFLDAPLPAKVVCEDDLTVGDRIAGRRAHYFSLASEHDASIADGANVRMTRRKIQSIAANRLSCTLASAYPTSATFPYLISPNDGRLRVGEGAYSNRGKAIIEHKGGERVLFEGNIVENFREYWRIHPSNQWEGRQVVNSMTIQANGSFHINDAGFSLEPFMQTMVTNRHTNGAPWPYAAFVAGSIGSPFTGAVALVDTITGVDGTFKAGANNLGAQSNFGQFWNMPVPFTRDQDFTIRYNHARGMQPGPSIHGNAINAAEIWLGERFSYTHNVQEDTGDKSKLGVNGASPVGAYADGEANFAFWHGCKRSADVWPGPRYGKNSPMQVAHNTFVRFHTYKAIPVIQTMPQLGNGIPQPSEYSTDLDFDANVADGLTHAGCQMMDGTGQYWTAPYSHARNVLVGAGATANSAFPDNAILTAQDRIGYLNPTPDPTGLPSRFRGNYSLTDVYASTGTIASDGLALTISGTFPATVVPGQFVRLTVSGALKRIISGGSGTNIVRWSGDVGNHSQATAFTVGFKGTAPDGTDPGVDWAGLVAMTAGVDTLVEPDSAPAAQNPRALTGRAALAVF
ncbi:MAG TPA: hypothetical protein VFD85_01470 [Gemmatimonadales bacterium]|nr:hypothetical protein [Gemmatimonadales bacterium]